MKQLKIINQLKSNVMSGIKRRACEADRKHQAMHKEKAGHSYYSESAKDSGYAKYVEKHGLHFTNELAEMAICKMENISDDGHGKWSIKQVEAVVKTHNPAMHFMHCVTMGDLAYLANMYYADLYPESIQTENGCIKAAILIANDPDGYEGQAFCRWVADIMAKGKSIDWEKYC
jgi:hypothetical protein